MEITISEKCKRCVWHIQARCDGHKEPCKDIETYDDWDKWHANISEII